MAWIAEYHCDDLAAAVVTNVAPTGSAYDINLTGSAVAQVAGGNLGSGVIGGGALGKTGAAMPTIPPALRTASESDDRGLMFDVLGVGRSVWWWGLNSSSLGSGIWGVLSLDGTTLISRARRQSDSAAAGALTFGTLSTTTWHNVCLTYKRSTAVLTAYWDGIPVASGVPAGWTPGTQLMVGADGVNFMEWLTGGPAKDNLRVADHCPTDAEVLELALTPVAVSEPEPVEEASATLPLVIGFNPSAATPTADVPQASGGLHVALSLDGVATGEESEMAPSPVSDVLCSSWANTDDLPADKVTLLTDTYGFTLDQINAALMRASELLWAFSGRQWLGAGCEEDAVLRSYPSPVGTGSWPYSSTWGHCGCWAYGTWLDGRLYPAMGDYHGAHRAAPTSVRLPRKNVTSVVEVTVGGEVFVGWEMTTNGWLTRTDGQAWNVCGGDTEVTYRFGDPPPAGGRDAAIELGIEYLLDQANAEECRLPPNAVSLTRQGLTMELMSTDRPEFRTGLPLVDMWLEAVNPYRRPQSAQVWSPDVPRLMKRGATREV